MPLGARQAAWDSLWMRIFAHILPGSSVSDDPECPATDYEDSEQQDVA